MIMDQVFWVLDIGIDPLIFVRHLAEQIFLVNILQYGICNVFNIHFCSLWCPIVYTSMTIDSYFYYFGESN
jgi:hypothetical protein